MIIIWQLNNFYLLSQLTNSISLLNIDLQSQTNARYTTSLGSDCTYISKVFWKRTLLAVDGKAGEDAGTDGLAGTDEIWTILGTGK